MCFFKFFIVILMLLFIFLVDNLHFVIYFSIYSTMYFFINKFSLSYLFTFNDIIIIIIIIIIIYLLALFTDYSFLAPGQKINHKTDMQN